MALTAKTFAYDVLTNPRHTRWLAPLIVLGDALLCALIIWKIACKPRLRRVPRARADHSQTLKSTGRHICNKSRSTYLVNAITP